MRQLESHQLQEVESLIIKNEKVRAVKKIREILSTTNFENYRLDLSNLCRRSGNPLMGLKLLRGKIFSETKIPSPAEVISYSASLYQVGCHFEANEKLHEVFQRFQDLNDQDKQDVVFHLGLLEMSRWNYHKASRYFQQALKLKSLSEYRRNLCVLNLASCYSFYGKFFKAINLFKKIIDTTDESNFSLLHLSALEGLAQCYFYQSKYDDAIQLLQSQIISDNISIEMMRLKKWYCLAQLKKQTNSILYLEQMKKLRQINLVQFYFEEVRDCDFYLGLFENNMNDLTKIYFGTQFSGFKKKILYHLPQFQPNESWHHDLDLVGIEEQRKDRSFLSIDLDFYKKLTNLQRKLLYCLMRDFYRPISMGEIYSFVYDHAYFDPMTTPDRIRRSIYNLNKTLKQLHIPFYINSYSGFYILTATIGCRLMMQKKSLISFSQIEKMKKDQIFKVNQWRSCQEISEQQGWSRSKTQRWLKSLLDKRQILSRGSFKDRKYKCKSLRST